MTAHLDRFEGMNDLLGLRGAGLGDGAIQHPRRGAITSQSAAGRGTGSRCAKKGARRVGVLV